METKLSKKKQKIVSIKKNILIKNKIKKKKEKPKNKFKLTNN